MRTLTTTPAAAQEGDRLPDFGGTIARVAHREGGIVEVWFTDAHLAPLGFRPDYPDTLTIERR